MNPIREQHNAEVRARLARLEPLDGSVDFFRRLKTESEALWETAPFDKRSQNYQVQAGMKWNSGLDEAALQEFEQQIGFPFPEILRNYYRVMNGTDLPEINTHSDSGHPFTYYHRFYSWPNDVERIQEYIRWICEAREIDPAALVQKKISRILPVAGHRFLMIDIPGNPVLSMYGADIVFWANDLCALLLEDIFGSKIALYPAPAETPVDTAPPPIHFWLDDYFYHG